MEVITPKHKHLTRLIAEDIQAAYEAFRGDQRYSSVIYKPMFTEWLQGIQSGDLSEVKLGSSYEAEVTRVLLTAIGMEIPSTLKQLKKQLREELDNPPTIDVVRFEACPNDDGQTYYVNVYVKRDSVNRETIADELTETEAEELVTVLEKYKDRLMLPQLAP